jgi:hypothetical protein
MKRGLERLLAELDAWEREGRTATLWWRDDDAADATPALDRLLELSERHAVPVAVAVIPARATPALQDRLARAATVTVLQHGYAHTNHAAPGQKKSEYPATRSIEEVRQEIDRGRQGLREFHGRAPVFVPPWNRCAPDLPSLLAESGFMALSGFGAAHNISRLLCLNCHADVTAWRSTRGFAGTRNIADGLLTDLMHRRSKRRGEDLPTGLLTHHLVHDEETWAFLDTLFDVTRAHRAVRWIKVASVLAMGEANPGEGA